MAENKKRTAPDSRSGPADKKAKTKKQWSTPKTKGGRGYESQGPSIEVGDAGIWATCDMGKEAKCVNELRNLFQEYAEKLYGDALNAEMKPTGDEEEVDIEAEISKEVQDMQKPSAKPLFTNVRIDVQCVLFFKTRSPVEPVSFVHAICNDALITGRKKTRFAKRLTPMAVMGRASESGLESAAKFALAPWFHVHDEDVGVKKFAIRPSVRNHNKPLSRDVIIKLVAELVGPNHKVDLTSPELVILVEVYQKICGISVVGGDYEKLKRYNLTELYQPDGPEDDAAN